jgi:hypothetical protein
MVGMTAIADVVPAHYQASAFPAFAAFAAAAVADHAHLPERAWRRVVLLVIAGSIAVVRLRGDLPLSGHALFLCASAAFDVRAADDEARAARLGLAFAGLATTAAYKLFVWRDFGWLAASAVVGLTLGIVLGSRRPS